LFLTFLQSRPGECHSYLWRLSNFITTAALNTQTYYCSNWLVTVFNEHIISLLYWQNALFGNVCVETRSQAIDRIADCTASQHLWGSRDVNGHLTIWYPICHFLLVVLWNRISISSRFRDIVLCWVTSLTFQGHVTSSVMWPFDSPYAISKYWWSFGTKPLSLTVSEIFNTECNAMVNMTLIRPLNKGQSHLFWYQSISHIWLPIGCQ